MIVDDSATARAVLREILEADTAIEVVGVAPDAYVARDKIMQLRPDVICLDVEMPRMDGISFLRRIMKYAPTPVVMVSSLTQEGARTTLDALEAGAVDFVPKPHANIYDGADEIRAALIDKVKSAAKANIKNLREKPAPTRPTPKLSTTALSETTQKVVAMGASTGGTEALKQVISAMPQDIPGIIIVQHMPKDFTRLFAERLNSMSRIEVREAQNGDRVGRGLALVCPGDYHMVLRRSGAFYYVEIGTGHKVSGHRPSVDVLFNSVAKTAGPNALGVIMTGMGGDGAKGMLQMHEAGAHTIAQDEKTSVVFGMPKVAIEMGGVDIVAPLPSIPEEILKGVEVVSRPRKRP
nr:chemotaxis response regulator protein-glutamate methylesterase [Desulfurispira natronophila]